MNLMELIVASREDDEDERPRNAPLPEAVADTLLEHYAALRQEHEMLPGTLVTFKPQFERRRDPYKGHPMLVADMSLEDYPPVERISSGDAMCRLDIVVLDYNSEHGVSLFRAWDRRTLMPWTPPQN